MILNLKSLVEKQIALFKKDNRKSFNEYISQNILFFYIISFQYAFFFYFYPYRVIPKLVLNSIMGPNQDPLIIESFWPYFFVGILWMRNKLIHSIH